MALADPNPQTPSQNVQDAAADSITRQEAAGATQQQVRREQLAVLYKSPGFLIGALILAFWILSSIFPGLLTSFDPKELTGQLRASPSADAWFGTDSLGRDVYSRVIFGARPVMVVAPLATILAVIMGSLLGIATGYFKGTFDEIFSRIAEAILSIPAVLLAIVIIFTFGPTDAVIVGTVAVLFTPPVLRTVRAATLSEAQLDYVTSAKMRGESGLFIITREILPNILGVVVVEFTVRLGYAIFTIATLAFLGITGGDATDADWGIDVANQWQRIVSGIWWPTVAPALAIASLVIAVNLIADSVEKAVSS